ncbi:MAG: class I SAM-dependent methyltransferase [Candidatus Peribacteraceae bacterium]|nr:class I SAM-dependent methyltransferase [Candidatus Peribacteraceae bacterium]
MTVLSPTIEAPLCPVDHPHPSENFFIEQYREQYINWSEAFIGDTTEGNEVDAEAHWSALREGAEIRSRLAAALDERYGRYDMRVIEDIRRQDGNERAEYLRRTFRGKHWHVLAIDDRKNVDRLLPTYRHRAARLLVGILAHFKDVRFPFDAIGAYEAAEDETGDAFEYLLQEVSQALVKLGSWDSVEERLNASGCCALQEDVLLQEISAIAFELNGEGETLREVLNRIKFVRARETAFVLLRDVFGSHIDTALGKSEPSEEPVSVLSLGAGNAQDIDGITRFYPHARGTAVDFDDPRPESERLNPNLTFVEENAAHYLREPDHPRQRVVWLKDVLHETEKPDQLLRQSANVLEDGGLLLIVEPDFADGDDEMLVTFTELDSTHFPQNLHPSSHWINLCRALDLEIVETQGLPPGKADTNDSFPRIAIVARKKTA